MRAVFLQALDRPPHARAHYLDRACGSDVALRDEVASLLAHHDERELIAEPVPAPAPDAPPLVGTVLDARYRVEALAAEGGFSWVYRATCLDGGPPVAIKVLKPIADDAMEAAFVRESELLERMCRRDPTIVRCHHVGRCEPLLYLVIEWLEGAPLPGGRWTVETVVERLGPIANALATCHAEGVAHRDVKPANVFVLRDGSVKLLDFGIAKIAADRAGGFLSTATGVAATFTVAYAAPEQLTGAPTGPWTDVYALAVVAVERIAGRHPLHGLGPMEQMLRIPDPSRRPTPRALGAAVSDEVEAVFSRALEVDAARRFPDAGSFWSALTHASALVSPGRPPEAESR